MVWAASELTWLLPLFMTLAALSAIAVRRRAHTLLVVAPLATMVALSIWLPLSAASAAGHEAIAPPPGVGQVDVISYNPATHALILQIGGRPAYVSCLAGNSSLACAYYPNGTAVAHVGAADYLVLVIHYTDPPNATVTVGIDVPGGAR